MIPDGYQKRRRPMLYALAAGLIAAGTVAGLDAAGTSLTSANSGLGGKLTPVSDAARIAPAASPAAASSR